jgi:hypothetical protein
MTSIRMRLKPHEHKLVLDSRNKNKRNVLIVGDLHAPFIKGQCNDGESYLEHCIDVFQKYNCNQVVMIGDLVDSHFSSFHETIPDGYSAGEELERAIDQLKPWHDAFPNALCCIGNHDAIISRKAVSMGISERWLKELQDALEVPTWTFNDSFEIDGVVYTHGTGSSGARAAHNRMVNWGKSVVQGHIHTECSITWHATKVSRHFSMQVGCGVTDSNVYALAYAKNFTKRSIIACGVVLDNGTLPMTLPMHL